MPLTDAIALYLDPETGLVNLHPGKTGKDSDNGFLFTVLYLLFLGDARDLRTMARLMSTLYQCRLEKGVFARYPGEKTASSFDDHMAIAVLGYFFTPFKWATQEVFEHGVENDWVWQGNELERIPIFAPTVKACKGVLLNLVDQVVVAGCFLQNCFEKKGEASGVDLLWLASQVFRERGSPIITLAMAVWSFVMTRRYGSMRGALACYFDSDHPDKPEHPLALFGPEAF